MSSNARSFRIENKTPLTFIEEVTVEGQSYYSYKINEATLNAPFLLGDQQVEALATIINDFIHADEEDVNTFAFKGYAGTGKTSIINMVEQYIKQIGATIAFTATTNRAVEVMRGSGVASYPLTIHGFMNLKLHIDIRDYNVDKAKLRKRSKNAPAKYDFVVIDEASMIDIFLYSRIIDGLVDKFNIRVIFMGDAAQLRPIGSNGISLSLRRADLSYQLTEIKRTSSVAIQSLVNGIRNGEVYNLDASQEHCFTSNKEEFLQYSLEKFQHLPEDVLSYRILCGTNPEAEKYNDYFHGMLFADQPDAEYHIGELIMAYKNGTEGFYNAMDGFVREIEGANFVIGDAESGTQETYRGYNLKILVSSQFPQSYESLVERSIEVTIPVLSKNNNWNSLEKYLDYLHDNAKQDDYEKLMKDYYFPVELKNAKGDPIIPKGIYYGYAMTVHKSQGGTYSNTGIVIDSFDKFRRDEDNYKELLYVAFSRCKESFVGLVNGGADTIAFATADEVSDQASQHVESVSMPLPDVGNTVNEETRQFNYNPEEIPF